MQRALDRGLHEGFNQDTGLIRLVAMATMLIDHMGVVLFPGAPELRIIGRVAFPLFCWGIVTGFCHTRSWPLYALRLGIAFFVAQPFYMMALSHGLWEFNVIMTLLLGLLSIVGMHEKRWCSHIWAPIACLAIAAAQQMDYGWRGVLLIQLMYLARRSPGGLAALMVSFCLYWGAGSSEVTRLFGVQIRPDLSFTAGRAVVSMLFSFIRMQGLAILSLPFILIKTNSGIRIPKWLSYSWYPGHLLILWLIRQAI